MLLSIIIPVYNVAPYLTRCLDSVRAAIATWGDSSDSLKHAPSPIAEIICIDDGSTDGSGKILDDYFAAFHDVSSSVRIVHQPNAGVSAARNAGLDLATGDWVMFIDADDTWDKDLLLQLFSEIDRHPDCDAVCFSGRLTGDEVEHWGHIGCYSGGEMAGPSVLASADAGIGNAMWVVVDKLYRRSLLERVKLRFLSGVRIGEDSLFAQQYLAVAQKVHLKPLIVGYNYLMRTDSAFRTPETSLPASPLATLMTLYHWWCQYPSSGLQKVLLRQIRGTLRLGLGKLFAPSVAKEGLEYLLHSVDYNRVLVPVVLRHGRSEPLYKFMWAYFLAPRCLKRVLLRRVRTV